MNTSTKSDKAKQQKYSVAKPRVESARVLSLLIAIGISACASSLALGGQSLHLVSSPFINNSNFYGTVAITDKDIWAVGYSYSGSTVTLAEHFDGTSWSVVPTP